MEVSHAQMVDFLRSVHARPGGTGAILNLIRGSEVRGAADLSVMTDLVPDPQRKMDLARHAFDEARHGLLLLRRMNELGFQPFRLPPELDRLEGLLGRSRAPDVKDIYTERGTLSEAALMEVAIAAYIPENDAAVKLKANYDALDNDPRTQSMLGGIIRDEQRHIAYLGAWLERFEKRFSRRAVDAALQRLTEEFRQLDIVYYGAMQEYFDRTAAA